MMMTFNYSNNTSNQISTLLDTGPTIVTSVANNYELHGRGDDEIEIYGSFVGFASSHRTDHTHLTRDDEGNSEIYAKPNHKCSGCRWFEIRIFVVEKQYDIICTCGVRDNDQSDTDDDIHAANCGEMPNVSGKYLVLTSGVSIVPGEEIKRRAVWVNSPYEIIEVLMQNGSSGPFMPLTSKRAIACAANYDRGIRDMYTAIISRQLSSNMLNNASAA